MSVPTLDSKHVAEALAFLTEQFKSATNLRGLLTTPTLSVQEIENVFWDIINKRLLSPSLTGDQEDQIGAIVGEAREGRTDADYYAAIILRIRVNRSQGRSVDVIDVARLATALQPTRPQYLDLPPAGFLVEAWSMPTALTLAELLHETRAAGTYGMLHYSTWADGNDFEFSSRYDSTAGQGVWGSRYDSTVGGLMVAGASI